MSEQQLNAEAELERQLEAYILNTDKRYLFSGVVNLLTTIAGICEEQSELARPIGDHRPFMLVVMPDGWSDGLVVMRLADYVTHHGIEPV